MNLRTLKKLSKRAAPLLVALGDRRQQFPALKGDSYHGYLISDRKHWERRRCRESYEPRNDYLTPRGAERVFVTRAGRRMVTRPPSHPLKGIVMVGGMSGGYEPEWHEECAWAVLHSWAAAHFTDWAAYANSEEPPMCSRDLSTSRKVLDAAREMLVEARAAGGGGD